MKPAVFSLSDPKSETDEATSRLLNARDFGDEYNSVATISQSFCPHGHTLIVGAREIHPEPVNTWNIEHGEARILTP